MKLFSFHNGERRIFSASQTKTIRKAAEFSRAEPKRTVVVVAHHIDNELEGTDLLCAALNGEVFTHEEPITCLRDGKDFFETTRTREAA